MNNVSAQVNNMVIKDRSDGRYEGRITINNKRKSFYGITKSEVKKKAKEYLQKVENGFREPQKITLNDYLEYWLVTYKRNKIEPTSYTRLWRVYECQVKNTIGEKMIGSITTKDIQDLIEKHANPIDHSIKALSISGLKRIVHLLNPCFLMATKEEIIQVNPCEDVKIPKQSYVLVETKQQYSLNDEEIEKFRASALCKTKGNEYCNRDGLILLIILNLGLRSGEMLALKWEDIDFKNKLVTINKTQQVYIKDFENVTGKSKYNRIKNETKTNAGMRTLKMNVLVEYYMNEILQYNNRHEIQTEFVCCKKNGEMNDPRNLQRSIKTIAYKAGIPKNITPHILRHTFGSTLLRRGIKIEVVSKLLGHANITITYNKYIHTIQEQEAKAMDMIKIC